MRIIKAFGQYIDLDPIIQISDYELVFDTYGSVTENAIRFNPLMVRVCHAYHILRAEPIIYAMRWPEYSDFDKMTFESIEAKRAYHTSVYKKAQEDSRDQYDFFLQSWKENRPNYLELAVPRHH